MPMWRRLLAGRARMWARSLVPGRRRGRHVAAAWLGLGLAVAFGLLVYLSLLAVFRTQPIELGVPEIAVTVLSLMLGAAFVGLIVFDLHDAVTTLVTDSDLPLLRRAPITAGAMLALKLVDAFPRTAPAVAAIALPAALAYGTVIPLGAGSWLILPVVILSLWALPIGLGVSAALVLLSIVPARRARETLASLATVTVMLVWAVNALLLPRLVAAERTFGDWDRAVTGLDRATAWSPGSWAARAIAATGHGDIGEAWSWTSVLVGASVASLGLATLASAWLLDSVQARVAVPHVPRRAPSRAPRGQARAVPRDVMSAVIERDGMLYARDWATLADVVASTALWGLLPLVAAPVFEADAVQTARAMLLALTVGLGYEIAARAFPLERRGLAWMRLAPVSGWSWVLGRYVTAGTLAVLLFALGTMATSLALGVRGQDLVDLLALAVPALALSLATGLWTGATFGDPEWRSARGMLTLPGRLAASALLLLQALGWILLATLAEANRHALPPFGELWLPAMIVVVPTVLLLLGTASRLQRPA